MRNDLVVSQSIDVNATPSQVWNALTNPEIIKEYLFGTETVTDWKEGSEIVFQGQYGENGEHKYRDHGTILQIVENKLLSYSYWSGFSGLEDTPENYATVTYTITPKTDTVTEFNWTQKGYASEDGYKHAIEGIGPFLQQIKAIIER